MKHTMKSRAAVVRYTAGKVLAHPAVQRVVPDARQRTVMSNNFYRVISIWEAAALWVPGLQIPTITSTLRGDAEGWRDQTWGRRIASAGMLATMAWHLFGGYPKAWARELQAQYEEQWLAQRRAEQAAASAANGARQTVGS